MKKYISLLLVLVLAVIPSALCVSCSDGSAAGEAEDTAAVSGEVAEQDEDEPQKSGKTYAADTLLDENGKLGNDTEGDLTVAYIGGSLTVGGGGCYTDALGRIASCGGRWSTDFCRYLAKQFPNRNVRGYNAGIGGTTSDYGALRFQQCVLDFKPDIVFIEFAVNDDFSDRLVVQKYMEYMVNMAKQCEHEPVVIFLYAPRPVSNDTAEYERWKFGVDCKEEVARAYSVGSVDVYDYIYRLYEKSGLADFMEFLAPYYSGKNSVGYGIDAYDHFYKQYEESGRSDFTEFFAQYIDKEAPVESSYNVHGGYGLYYDAIIEKIENDASSLIHRMGDPEEPISCDYGRSVCVTHKIDEDMFVYDDSWEIVKLDEFMAKNYDNMSHDIMNYPYFMDGLIETTTPGAALTFRTKASELIFAYVTAYSGNTATVYVDGVECGSFNIVFHEDCAGQGVRSVILPGDGEEHEVKLVNNEPDEEGRSLFRIGYISEVLGR